MRHLALATSALAIVAAAAALILVEVARAGNASPPARVLLAVGAWNKNICGCYFASVRFSHASRSAWLVRQRSFEPPDLCLRVRSSPGSAAVVTQARCT